MLTSVFRVLRHKGPIGLLNTFYYVAKIGIYRHLLGRRYMRKRIFNWWMDLDIDDRGICRTLLLFGRREEDHRIILEKVLKEGMTVFDIGANIGYYPLMEHQLVGRTGRVVAIEPSPFNVELLKRNLALNGCDDDSVLPIAISDQSGNKPLLISKMSNLNTFHDRTDGGGHLSGEIVDVETRSVPDLAAEFGPPDLIRMDVEGHEVEVINGMLEAIEMGEMAPMIIFEVHIRHYTPEHDMVEPLQRLFACGYGVRYAASSSARGTELVNARGYCGGPPTATDFMTRVIYENIGDEDALDIICRSAGLRTVLLAKQG